MPPQEGGQDQTGIGADGGGEESVDVGENGGLLCDSGPKQARPASRSERRIARVRGDSVAILVRLFEPISLLFPKGTRMPSLLATVPSPNCIICDGPASPPSRTGWLHAPDRQALFACCGICSDCDDSELEAKIVAKISGEPTVPAIAAE